MLEYQIIGKNFVVTDAMKDILTKRLKKLEKYFAKEKEIPCRVVLSSTKTEGKVEITLYAPNVALRAEEKQKDLYAAFDDAVSKLIGQIRKLKTRNDRSNNRISLSEVIILEQEEEAKKDVIEDLAVVRNKKIELEPMSLEEAILRMDALGHSFFVYLDQDNHHISVVYRRVDRGYGVIEADNRLL